MSRDQSDTRTPAERVGDIEKILDAMGRGIRKALLEHKRAGNPVAIWRDGAVVWLAPEEIPVSEEEPALLADEG